MTETVLLLCHRRAHDQDVDIFFSAWAASRAELVRSLQHRSGYASYFQVQRVSRLHPVYVALRLSRHPLITACISALKSLRPAMRRPSPSASDEERWDLLEFFVWHHDPGRVDHGELEDMLARLQSHADGRVRRSQQVLAARPAWFGARPMADCAAVVTFCLRPRPGLGVADMLDYWLRSHGPFVNGMRKAIGFARYEQITAIRDTSAGSGPRASSDPFAGAAVLGYRRMRDLAVGTVRPATIIANLKLVWDESGFMNHRRSALVLGRVANRLAFTAGVRSDPGELPLSKVPGEPLEIASRAALRNPADHPSGASM